MRSFGLKNRAMCSVRCDEDFVLSEREMGQGYISIIEKILT